MHMRHSNLPIAVLLGAALSFLPGCESTRSSNFSSLDAPLQEAVPVQAADAWERARVGDRVTYAFSATHGPGRGGGTARTLDGLLTLEVAAVRQPWVWVRLAYTDEAGQPLSQPRLASELVVPVRADSTRPLDVPPAGEASAETPSIAGRTWEALRYVSDQRPVDGPLRTRVYANNAPGPLYLTRGLLDASMETAGFVVPGGIRLTLREFREGSADADAPVPSLERPLGPGAYYERHVDVGPSPSVQRVCFAAERGYILRTEGPVDAHAAPCADFSQAEPEPLEELLMSLPWEALSSGEWPPSAAGTRGTFTVEGRAVPALIEQRAEDVEGTRLVFMESYAAEPWAPALAGLPYEARFQPLSSGTERVTASGQRESQGGTRLVRWGSWLGGQP